MQVSFTFCCKLQSCILLSKHQRRRVLIVVETDFIQEPLRYGKKDLNIELGSILKAMGESRDS